MSRWVETIIIAVMCGGLVASYLLFRRPQVARKLLQVRLESIELRLLKLQLAGNYSADVDRLLGRVRAIQEDPPSAATAPANAAVRLSKQTLQLVAIAEAYDDALRTFQREAWPRASAGKATPWPSAVALVGCPRAGGCTHPGGCPLRPACKQEIVLETAEAGGPRPAPRQVQLPTQPKPVTATAPDSVTGAQTGPLSRGKKITHALSRSSG